MAPTWRSGHALPARAPEHARTHAPTRRTWRSRRYLAPSGAATISRRKGRIAWMARKSRSFWVTTTAPRRPGGEGDQDVVHDRVARGEVVASLRLEPAQGLPRLVEHRPGRHEEPPRLLEGRHAADGPAAGRSARERPRPQLHQDDRAQVLDGARLEERRLRGGPALIQSTYTFVSITSRRTSGEDLLQLPLPPTPAQRSVDAGLGHDHRQRAVERLRLASRPPGCAGPGRASAGRCARACGGTPWSLPSGLSAPSVHR